VLLVLPVLAVLVVVLVLLNPTMRGIGGTDLTVEFVITDAESGQPIDSAALHIHSEGGFYADNYTQDFRLVTDSEGIARSVCHENRYTSRSGGLWSTNTFAVYLPDWFITVIARDYQTTESLYLKDIRPRRAAERTGKGQSRVVVPISLRKASS
jgi:hypothetical protein